MAEGMNREQLVKRIKAAKEEVKTAGHCHRRDLNKFIKRMQRELRDYDRFMSAVSST
jgi:ribosome recycling factor